MGNDLLKGTNYAEGQQVNAANLNAHVDDATIKYTAISSKSLKDPASLSDEIMINDDGILKKITLQQISSLLTIPVGTVNDFAGTTAPNGWLMCYGQAISRTTYAALFDVIGVAFGSGDGSSTFSLPDCRGRVSAGKDNMGGVSANRMVDVVDGDVLGNTGGAEKYSLLEAELASHAHPGGPHVHNNPAHQHYTSGAHQHYIQPHTHSLPNYLLAYPTAGGIAAGGGYAVGGTGTNANALQLTDGSGSGWSDGGYGATTSSVAVGDTGTTGTGEGHDNVQPTIIFNKIIKI